MGDQDEDYSSLPITDRATHKIWKVRLAAYEDMKSNFTKSASETDACFRPFLDNPGIYKKIVTDSNVVAQEAGISSLVAFLEFGGSEACLRLRGSVVGPLAEKSLGSTRAGTKQKCIEALLWFIELDTPDPIIENIVPFLTHRIPKLVAGVAAALTEIFKSFGAKTVSPKPVVKLIPKLFSHADKNVRKEATGLVIELYKWLGSGFSDAILPDLKPVQQKELEAEFEKVKDQSPHQERYLRSQREAMERQQLSGIAVGKDEENDEDDEDAVNDFIEAVDVSSSVPDQFVQRLGSSKWKDRKEVLEEFYPVVNVPKIKSDDYGDIIRLLAKCMKDANVQVVTLAANIIECFAKGLRADFAKYVSFVLSPMLERLKEKKATVAEALRNALDAVYKSSSLSDIIYEVLEFLKHKTPQVKIETAKFLARCLKSTKVMPKPAEIKVIAESSIKLLGDTQEPVRTGGAEILGIVMKLIGDRAMTPYLESIDDIKKAKITEFYNTAEVKAKPAKAAPPAPAPVKAPPRSAGAASAPSAVGRSSTNLMRKKGPGASPAVPDSPATPKRKTVLSRAPLGDTKTLRRPALVSPSKSKPLEPAAAPAAPGLQRPGAPINKGLTGRSLMTGRAPPPVDTGLIAAEKAELEQLRQEKVEWQREKEHMNWQLQEDNTEKARLMQEINNLQVKNAQLVEDHTRDVLAIKSKETQLIRAQSDLETAQLQINQLENEMDRAARSNPLNINTSASKRSSMYQRLASPTSPIKSPHKAFESPRRYQGHSQQPSASSNLSSSSHFSSGSHGYQEAAVEPDEMEIDTEERNPVSYRPMSYQEPSRSNQFGGPTRFNNIRNSYHGSASDMASGIPSYSARRTLEDPNSSALPTSAGGNMINDNRGSNWKRAAEVTVQLKARIEAMKARQNQNRTLPSEG